MSTTPPTTPTRVVALVSGRVQMVGFRFWTRQTGLSLGLTGRATNLPDGRVEVIAEGPEDSVAAMVARLHKGPWSARVDDVTVRFEQPQGMDGFDMG